VCASLTAWDGLTGTEAAAVLGISPIAYRIRLTRARRALRALLESTTPATTHTAGPSFRKGHDDALHR
jgi:RNA polymerase sigma-70 factor, ECF subfamily